MNAAIIRAAWLFCALVGLSCFALYFASSAPVARLDDKILSLAADTTITNLTLKQFDQAGKMVNYLQSIEVQHVPNNNTHWLKSPHIILSQPDQPAWEISSEQAKAIQGGEEITFIHHVIIHQNKSATTQENTMKTEELTYFSKTKLASTALMVSFEQPGTKVHSQGMKAYLADKRIQLLSQTRAIYEPNHS